MTVQRNKMVFSGSMMDAYALQEFLTEQNIVSTVFDPTASAAAAGVASSTLGVHQLYVNELDFTEASNLVELFLKNGVE